MKERFSYTKIDTFDKCQFKYKLKYKDWLKEDTSNADALNKGNLVHILLERKINNETDIHDIELTEVLLKITKEDTMKILKMVKKFINGDFFTALNFDEGVAEQTFYLNTKLEPCEKPAAFISGKIDYREVKDDYVLIIDWKTGKKTLKEIQLYKKNDLQLDLYALWALQKFTDVETVQAMLYYVESNVADEKLYSKKDIQKLKDKVLNNINTITNTTDFKRNLGPLCDYCSFFSTHCLGI